MCRPVICGTKPIVKRQPSRIHIGNESEFQYSDRHTYLCKQRIKHFVIQNVVKAEIAEKGNMTIKMRLHSQTIPPVDRHSYHAKLQSDLHALLLQLPVASIRMIL